MQALLPKAIASSVPIPEMQLEVLATEIDMRPETESVDDQKSMGSCVAHAGQTALEICFARAGQPTDLSRMYLYYFVQLASGTLGQSGAHTGQLGKAVEDGGVCKEVTFPYFVDREGWEPTVAAEAEAREMFPKGSTSFTRVQGLKGIKQALNRGMPVMITMYVHFSMMYMLGKDWRKHEWDIKQTPLGLHAVTVIGYDDAAGRLLCENSWGSKYGDGGFFGIRYDYVNPWLVLDSFAFDKLPVPLVQAPGYIPEDPAKFDPETGILTLPTIRIYLPDLAGAIDYKRVAVRITKLGRLKVDDPDWTPDATNYFMYKFMSTDQVLVLPIVIADGGTYKHVTLTNAEYEILAGEPA